MDNTGELREVLANLCHEQWSGWMKYLFEKGTFNIDGTWTMPAWAVERWTLQVSTSYDQLSEDEQDSDLAEAEKFVAVLVDLVNKRRRRTTDE